MSKPMHITCCYGSHGDRTPYDGSQCWPGDNSIWSCDFTHGEIPLYWPPTEYPNGIPRLYEKGTNRWMDGWMDGRRTFLINGQVNK